MYKKRVNYFILPNTKATIYIYIYIFIGKTKSTILSYCKFGNDEYSKKLGLENLNSNCQHCSVTYTSSPRSTKNKAIINS